MRFEQVPSNQLNINFDTQENQIKTEEQIRDEFAEAIIARCEVKKQKSSDSKPMITSIKKLREMIESGQKLESVREVDLEAERRTKEYWDKVYSGIRPKDKPAVAYLGKKIQKSLAGFVDYKKSQYKDDVADEELN